MQKVNYDNVFKQILSTIEGRPKLLLHVCCAPCSTHVLDLLTRHFDVTALFYNPNIFPQTEHERRLEEFERYMQKRHADIVIAYAEYTPEDFYSAVKGLEALPEGGERCFTCYALRLDFAASYAAQNAFSYFTTTLSISPRKNSQKLNQIGQAAAQKHGVSYLFSDFKKQGGYLNSLRLSAEESLYRQAYCGCKFSVPAQKPPT